MQKNLEKLQQEMPLVFELRDDLVRQVAEGTADYHIEIDRLRAWFEEDGEGFERKKRQVYDEFRASMDPIRKEIEAINKRIADILATTPLDPIVITDR